MWFGDAARPWKVASMSCQLPIRKVTFSTHAWSHSCENPVRNYAVLVYFLLWNRNTFIPGWPLSHYVVEADLEPWSSFLYLLNSGIINRYHEVWISWIHFILFKWGSRILGLILFCFPPREHPSILHWRLEDGPAAPQAVSIHSCAHWKCSLSVLWLLVADIFTVTLFSPRLPRWHIYSRIQTFRKRTFVCLQ